MKIDIKKIQSVWLGFGCHVYHILGRPVDRLIVHFGVPTNSGYFSIYITLILFRSFFLSISYYCIYSTKWRRKQLFPVCLPVSRSIEQKYGSFEILCYSTEEVTFIYVLSYYAYERSRLHFQPKPNSSNVLTKWK